MCVHNNYIFFKNKLSTEDYSIDIIFLINVTHRVNIPWCWFHFAQIWKIERNIKYFYKQ